MQYYLYCKPLVSYLFFIKIQLKYEQAKTGSTSLRMAPFLQVINLFQFVFFFFQNLSGSTSRASIHYYTCMCVCDTRSIILRFVCMPLLPSVLFLTSELKRIIKNLPFFVIHTKGNGILYHQSKIDFIQLLKKHQHVRGEIPRSAVVESGAGKTHGLKEFENRSLDDSLDHY